MSRNRRDENGVGAASFGAAIRDALSAAAARDCCGAGLCTIPLGRRACRAMVDLVVGTHFVFFCGGWGAVGVGSPVGPYLSFCMLLMARPPGACA